MNVREQFLSWGMVGAYVILNSFGALAIKRTVHQIGAADPTSMKATVTFLTAAFLSPLTLSGLFAIGLSACAWIVALSRMELSVAYPIAVALNCLIVVSAGFATYGEALNTSKLAGIGLLLCSLVLLFRG
jgi:multidrug transporter EmrE-like cation transporter